MLGDSSLLPYEIPLFWSHSLLSDAPDEKVESGMLENKDCQRLYECLSWVGIDPGKQDFLSLKESREVVVEEAFRIQVRLPVNLEYVKYETAAAGTMDDFWLPRRSVQIEFGRVTAITRSLRDDILYLNAPADRYDREYPRHSTPFDPAALTEVAVASPAQHV